MANQSLASTLRTRAHIGAGLKYYTEKLQPKESLQLVLNLGRAQEKSGIRIVPLGKWLESLD